MLLRFASAHRLAGWRLSRAAKTFQRLGLTLAMGGIALGLPALTPYGRGAEPASVADRDAEVAAGDYVVNFLRREEGLPDNTVSALLQTRDGYLWVGTASGLARFDGLVFTALGEETARGLKRASITALLEDHLGGVWVGTQDHGVLRLRDGDPQWFNTSSGLAGDVVTSLAEDAAGCVWIGSLGGITCWQNGKLRKFTSAAIRADDGIVALHAGRSGTVWVTTRSGVYRVIDGRATRFESEDLPQGRNSELIGAYEDRSGKPWAFGATFLLNLAQGSRFNYFRSPEFASSRVWTICEQEDGAFWIGTSGRGLFRFQDGRFEATGVREGLNQCDVRALYADRFGNLWIGTSGNGLARLRRRGVKFISTAEAMNAHKVAAIAAGAGNQVWVGTLDTGLLGWNGRQLETFAGGPPLDRITQVQTLCVDRQGALWVGTRGMGLVELKDGRQRVFSTADGLGSDVVQALASESGEDAVWAGTQAGTLHRISSGNIQSFGMAEGLTGNPINCLLWRNGRTLLVGSEGGGLVRWDGKRMEPFPAPRAVANWPVRCLFEDSQGRLWVGTRGAGTYCLRGEYWAELSTSQGLGADVISQIAQDETGSFWFGTDEGYFRVASAEMESFLADATRRVECVPGGVEAGIDSLKCPLGWPGTACATNGLHWLATRSGLLPLVARNLPIPEPPPPVIIESVLVNGQKRPRPQNAALRLGPSARSLDFGFTAISFNSPQKLRFRHRLENYETDWVTGDAARRAHYGPLPPGRYRFRVTAATTEGLWNDTGATISLVVVPPVWRSGWFLSLAAIAVVTGIWAVARYISTRRLQSRLRAAEQQHAMARERARIAQDMHDEIGSKLTRISFLSEVARNSGSDGVAALPSVEAIASTSRELLQALDEIVWAVNPRNDNLEQLAGYLEGHAREYFQATSLECQIQVPPQLPRVPLSAETRHNVFLAFEEALNNTLKHGRARQVRIGMRAGDGRFAIRVEDDGRGFELSAAGRAEQDGLGNMSSRLAAVGGACEISSTPGRGTVVILSFPIPAAETANPVRTTEEQVP